MIDISSLNPLFIQIPLLAILIIGLFSGLKDGIVKKLLDIVFFAILVVLMVFFVPPLATKLEATGWIQNFVNANITGEFATVISSLLTGPVYVVITSAGVLLIYFIVKFFVNFLLNRLFGKNIFIRILGGIWQTAVNLVFCGLLMVVIASPSIFKGGHELLSTTDGVKEIYGGVTKVQEVLKNKNLPYSLESVFGKVLAGKDATIEDIERFQSTLERMPSIIESVNNGTIVNDVIDSEGNINQEKANELLGDMIVFTQLVNKLPESQQASIKEPIANQIVEASKALDGVEGTITVTKEQHDSFKEILGSEGLNVDQSVIEIFDKHLIIE